MGLVHATSPCNKSQGLVPSFELTIFATKSSCRDQNLVLATSLTNSNWFEFLGLVTGTKVGPCNQILKQKWPVHMMRLVPATSHRDQLPVHTMQLVPATCCRNQSQGLVPSCVPALTEDYSMLTLVVPNLQRVAIYLQQHFEQFIVKQTFHEKRCC